MKNLSYIALLSITALTLSACSSSAGSAQASAASPQADSTAQTASSAADTASGEAKVIKVATGNSFAPYAYVNEKGELDGFSVALLKEVDERNPEYSFELEGTSMEDVLLGVETGNYAFGSYTINKTSDREEKYLFTEENTGFKNTWVVIKKGRTDIQTLDDLAGKTFVDTPGKSFYVFMEEYNAANPGKEVELVGIDQLNNTDRLKYIADGKYDASVISTSVFQQIQDQANLDVELGFLLFSRPTYYVLNKADDSDLKDKLDAALKSIHEDGTLSKLSNEYLAEDVSVQQEAQAVLSE